jgi:hypothetical protein
MYGFSGPDSICVLSPQQFGDLLWPKSRKIRKIPFPKIALSPKMFIKFIKRNLNHV